MVRISPEEVIARRQTAKQLDDLPSWKKEALGASARLDIPLDSLDNLQKAAAALNDLAASLGSITGRRDLDPYTVLISAKYEIMAANKQIRHQHGKANKNGTFPRGRSD